MEIKGKKYSLYNIIFIILFFTIFIYFSQRETDESLLIYQKELNHKENWLLSELEGIADFLDFKKNKYDYTNRDVWFIAWYVSPEFNKNKLWDLRNYLLKEGWVDLTEKIDKNDYISKTSSNSNITHKYVRILCNNKATIFMYMTDMSDNYESKSLEAGAGTLVELFYDYSLPCYNLNEK